MEFAVPLTEALGGSSSVVLKLRRCVTLQLIGSIEVNLQQMFTSLRFLLYWFDLQVDCNEALDDNKNKQSMVQWTF